MTDTFEEWVTAIENVGILQKLFQYVLMFIGYRGTHLHEMKQEIHKIFLVGTGAETDPFTNDFDKKYNALTSTRNTDNIVELITSTKKLRDYFQHKDANRYSASRAHISKLLVKVIIEQCASDNECISTSSKTFNLTNNVETHSLNLTNKVETHNPNVYVHSTAYLDVTNFFNALTKRHHVNFVHKFDLESLPYGSVIIFVYFSRPSEDFSEHNKIASERISKYGTSCIVLWCSFHKVYGYSDGNFLRLSEWNINSGKIANKGMFLQEMAGYRDMSEIKTNVKKVKSLDPFFNAVIRK